VGSEMCIRDRAYSGGNAFTLFLKTDGSVWAAGSNKYGSFGVTTPDILSLRPIPVTTGIKSVAASLGSSPSIFLRPDGVATLVTSKGSKPIGISGIDTIIFGSGALLKRTDGSVWEEGFLLSYSDTESTTPRKVQGVPGCLSISSGNGVGLALDSNNWVWGFGIPSFGEKGSGSASPIWADTLTRVIAVGAKTITSGAYHSLIVKSDGSVDAAGLNSWGQLGKGTVSAADSVFSTVAGVADVKNVAAGWTYSLFLKSDGTLFLAGMIVTEYKVGYPQGQTFPIPHQIATDVSAIWAGFDWCMFQKADGTLWAFGSNSEGAFGNGTRESSATPVRINF